ncbi:MAG TPA: endonuclease/exonuclease/phosphatase family protein [Acidimicrobiales bacterium]|nr:endonuclease/exonuclease/phosphatase family protein [Acidimicrobiales bacterium]
MARITLASYNVHWSRDKQGRPFDAVEVCRALDADVVALQESWLPDGEKSDADRAAAELGYTVSHSVMGRGRVTGRRPRLCPEAVAQGTLVVSLLSRLPVVATEVQDLRVMPMDTAPRRLAVHADIDVDGERFTYVVTHLDHLSHGSPVQLRQLVRRLPGPDRPTALAGDMNMWGPLLSLQMPGWSRAVRGRTWPRPRPHSQIDHIMVNRAVRPVDWAVLQAGRSDHLPVRATVSF